MTKIDTSRETVERLAKDCHTAMTCLRDVGSFESGQGILKDAADTLRALLARAEKVEAERDAAWNAAIEAAAKHAASATGDADLHDSIRALKRDTSDPDGSAT